MSAEEARIADVHTEALREIFSKLGSEFDRIDLNRVLGGDINQSFKVKTGEKAFFLKTNSANNAGVLASEHQALRYMGKRLNGGYPEVLHYGVRGDYAYLLMAWHGLAPITGSQAPQLATLLAKQHSVVSERYGWPEDNHIGTSVQKNGWYDDWGQFFVERRLKPQLALASQNGLDKVLCASLLDCLPHIKNALSLHRPQACLVHGDLWAGNAAFDLVAHEAILYDPAPYFGDREVDLAMTQLFGTLSNSFYRSYANAFAPCDGFKDRVPMYNLYHALNHVSLFGAHYNGLVRDLFYTIDH